MLNLSELEQFVTFAEQGTLSGAAQTLHISQPTLTRTMKHVEAAFGVPLFRRSKNKIELNETGLQAVQQAKNLLSAAAGAVQQVHSYHARLHTIAVESCAPAPLWSLLPVLSASFPERTVSSRLSPPASIAGRVLSGRCEIGILPYPEEDRALACLPVVRERLFVCVPPNHPLAERGSLTFAELNGLTCLLRSEIGFWIELCRRCMPASKFLIQTDEFAFRELVRESALPCFSTNLSTARTDALQGRTAIPITDAQANVVYYFICRKADAAYRAAAAQWRAKLSAAPEAQP